MIKSAVTGRNPKHTIVIDVKSVESLKISKNSSELLKGSHNKARAALLEGIGGSFHKGR